MSYGLRLAVVALAAFSVTSLAVSLAVPAIWRRVPVGAPSTRADLFFLVRLLPTLSGALASAVIVLSFHFFEPAVHAERIGLALIGLAALGAASIVWSCVQLTRQWLLTRRVVRGWLRTASTEVARPAHPSPDTPIDVVDITFPIVALVGLVSPRLIVARRVMDACPPDEWRAIVAHEEGHRVRRDNLRRALVTAAPDLLSRLRIGRRLADDWHQVTEEAADEQAALLGERGRINLAQALIRVARLAPMAGERDLPASALYRGENIDRRVRGLLAPPLPAVPAPPRVWRLGIAGLALVGLALTVGLVQVAIEGAVEFLP